MHPHNMYIYVYISQRCILLSFLLLLPVFQPPPLFLSPARRPPTVPLLPASLARVLLDGQVADPEPPGRGQVDGPGEQAGAAGGLGNGEPDDGAKGAGGAPGYDLPRRVVVEVDPAPGDGGGDEESEGAPGNPLESGHRCVVVVTDGLAPAIGARRRRRRRRRRVAHE